MARQKNRTRVKRTVHAGTVPMTKARLIALFLVAILFTISVVEIIYFFYNVKHVKVYDATLRVENNKIGINADTDLPNGTLDFGVLPPGGSVKRDIIMVNSYDIPLYAGITSKGSLAPFLSFEETSFFIQPGETKSISIIAKTPFDIANGNYSAKIILTFSRG